MDIPWNGRDQAGSPNQPSTDIGEIAPYEAFARALAEGTLGGDDQPLPERRRIIGLQTESEISLDAMIAAGAERPPRRPRR